MLLTIFSYPLQGENSPLIYLFKICLMKTFSYSFYKNKSYNNNDKL